MVLQSAALLMVLFWICLDGSDDNNHVLTLPELGDQLSLRFGFGHPAINQLHINQLVNLMK